MNNIDKAIEEYQAVRMANALDITAPQVLALNRIERDANENDIEVEITSGVVHVEWSEDIWHYSGTLRADGSFQSDF